MTSYILTGFVFLSDILDSSKIESLTQSTANEIIQNWWMIWVTIAIALIGVFAILVSIFQKKESIRAYRIALISILLEQLGQIRDYHKTEDLKLWLRAIELVLAKWAPREAKEIQEAIEELLKKKS